MGSFLAPALLPLIVLVTPQHALFSAPHIPVSLIHIENNQYGGYCSFLPQLISTCSFFHYYQNVSFIWNGSIPS